MEHETITVPEGQPGDFAILMEDSSLSPYVPQGGTVFIERSVELQTGDVGLFHTREGMAFRQFCEDCFGNVYLFSLDRTRRELDTMIPRGREMPVCYGRVLLPKPVPLPED